MFGKSNFTLGVPKNFGLDHLFTTKFHYQISPPNFTSETMPKTFWHSQNGIGFPKQWLGIQNPVFDIRLNQEYLQTYA